MSNRPNDLRNPNSNDSKTNQRRLRSMLLLRALALETLLSSRLKNIVEFVIPGKAQTFREDALALPSVDLSLAPKPEQNLLETLLKTIYSAATQFVSNVKNTLTSNISKAKNNGTLSKTAANHLQQAVDAVLTPTLLEDALELHKKEPKDAEAQIAKDVSNLQHKESRKFVKEILQRQKAPRPQPTTKSQAHSEQHSRRDLFDDMELLSAIRMMRHAQNSTQNYSHIRQQQVMQDIRTFLNGPGQFHQTFQTERTVFFETVQPALSSSHSIYTTGRYRLNTGSNSKQEIAEQMLNALTNTNFSH